MKKNTDIVDTYYNPVTRRYEVVGDRFNIKKRVSRKIIAITVFALILVLMIFIRLAVHVINRDNQIECVGGSPCVEIQKPMSKDVK